MHRIANRAGWFLVPLIAVPYSIGMAAPVQVRVRPVPPAAQTPSYSQQAPGYGVQAPQPGYYTPQRSSDQLSQYLALLGQNPNNLAALIGAGRAALDLGEGEAAVNFFGRAEELSPQDGQIKAGLGSALVLMEQPATALQFFYEAYRLGVPAGDMAAYRGLAYDLSGDPARAQQDYQLALRRREDPEVRRRLALSMAISGQKDPAIAMIQDQLRRQDRAAWRTQAFILALTGDAAGALRVVESSMPGQSAAMAPFLARLPALSAADRARAVHFGHFPGDQADRQVLAQAPVAPPSPPPAAAPLPSRGRVQVTTPAVPSTSSRALEPVTSAGRPDPGQRPFGEAVVPRPSVSVPQQPVGSLTASRPTQSSPVISPTAPTVAAPTPTVSVQPSVPAPAASLSIAPSPAPATPPIIAGPPVSLTQASTSPASPALTSTPVGGPVQPPPTPASGPGIAADPAKAPIAVNTPRLADIASLVATLSDPVAPKPPPPRSPPAKPAAIKPDPTKPLSSKEASAASAKLTSGKPAPSKPGAEKPGSASASKTEKAAPKEPSRIWVQIARGSNETALGGEYRRLRTKAPKPFTGKTGWTADQGASNRLLVGPFKTSKEAQDFVTALRKEDLDGFSWTSAAGQEIKKLPAR